MHNEDQYKTQSPGGPTGKETKPKPTAELFLSEWRAAVTSKKDPVSDLRARLKLGYAGEITEEHLTEMLSAFTDNDVILERLALPLAANERLGKPTALSRRFLRKVRASFEDSIHYDRAEFATYRGPQNIEDWVGHHAPETPAAERDSWLRRFIVCLVFDAESKTLLRGLLAASKRWLSSKGIKSEGKDAPFIRGILNALAVPGISARRLELVLSGVQLLEDQNRRMLNRELDLERQLRSKTDEVDSLNKVVDSLRRDVAAFGEEDQNKSEKIAELERLLDDAKERHALLDRHWRGVSEQELTKQSGSFRVKVGQEVEEALLALDRQEPNTAIALRRLRRIQEIVSK